jgi:hypothetical protein
VIVRISGFIVLHVKQLSIITQIIVLVSEGVTLAISTIFDGDTTAVRARKLGMRGA